VQRRSPLITYALFLPDYPTYFWITAITAVILVGIAKAGFGGGIGVIATPLMALTIPVADAAALLLPLLIIIDLISVRHYYRTYDKPSLRILLPSAIAGILIGALFFSLFRDNDRVLRMGIGLLALAFLAYQAGHRLLMGALENRRPPKLAGILLGALAGFASTLAHAGGPPAAIYLLPQGLARGIFVGTSVVFFTAVNLIKIVPYTALGLLRVGNLTTILLLAPLGYVGVRLGLYLNRRFNDVWFTRLIYILLLLTALELLSGQSLIGLLFK
jgi:uncharacterized membrane protein YfcA